jgi:proteic killer suppression protein
VIQSFKDQLTRDVFDGVQSRDSRRFPEELKKVARRKLDLVNAAKDLRDLLVPPGNRLEALKGDLKGFHSIRINDQWRLIFRWHESSPIEVQIVDYHD